MDPRLAAVETRLAGVGRLVAVTGGKGGVGKSSVASLLALLLADGGVRTGLLDLDLTGPSDHVILGAGDARPREERGLVPPRVHGIEFMSVSLFLGDAPAPLRGAEAGDALLELLAITRWQDPELLLIDMPPGLGDAALDAVRWLPGAEYLVVAGSSRLVLETARRSLRLLTELERPVAGIVENLRRRESGAVAALARELAVPWLGALPFDDAFEEALGDAEGLRRTAFARALRPVARALRADPTGRRAGGSGCGRPRTW